MSGGLLALLDDVAAMTRMAAASLDDIGAAATRAGVKAAGVVVDDTAVTPRYVTGFSPQRELPMIWRIAKGSLRNKLLFILPAALLLSALLPAAIPVLLIVGGAYLCYEGAEKVLHALGVGAHPHPEGGELPAPLAGPEQEEAMVGGAVRTDFILSAEIMALSLSEVAGEPLWMQAAILVVVALGITALVYGAVALIVKMDDIGLRLAETGRTRPVRALGRGLVAGMPKVLAALSVIGTAAMLWVGGHIVLLSLGELGLAAPYDWLHAVTHGAAHAVPAIEGFLAWLLETLGSAVFGLLLGALIVGALSLRPRRAAAAH